MLQKQVFRQLTTKEIKPLGWLKAQLEIQARGLSGHLDKVWPDIRDSQWIGGDREGWERVPYWLDGFIPLAYLLDDDDLKKRAAYYVDHIVNAQEADGWICPCKPQERAHYDLWAIFLICKVLVVYHDCTGDGRIEDVVYKVLRQLEVHIQRNTPDNWAAARWYECLIPLFWLYERRPEEWMLELAVILESEGIDYQNLYSKLEFQKPRQKRYWTYLNHVVNVAMALKSRALMSRLSKENPSDFAQRFYDKLMKYHSMPTGHFTGDECLSGDKPIQGSECCGVVEAMYSYEWLAALSGETRWSDLLERLAYNALPATTTVDMWAHQYLQLTNQMQTTFLADEDNPFCHNRGDAHFFGLEPHFGCCTANFNQGWPKFALSAIMETETGFAITAIAPVQAIVMRQGVKVNITVETEYPFRDSYRVIVKPEKPVALTVTLRIPGFVAGAAVDGTAVPVGQYYTVAQTFEDEVSFHVSMKMDVEMSQRPSGMYVVNRGPLLYSIGVKAAVKAVEYEKDNVVRKHPYCDYEMTPVSPWNYAFSSKAFSVEFKELPASPFDIENPSIVLKGKGRRIPWGAEGGICTVTPESLEPASAEEEIVLQPYGATNLRMTEIPLL